MMKAALAFVFEGRSSTWHKTLGRLALLALTPPALLPAQNRPVKFERIGIEQGLSQSTVWCILQDRQGFMWFGTYDGLNKYDGSMIIHKI